MLKDPLTVCLLECIHELTYTLFFTQFAFSNMYIEFWKHHICYLAPQIDIKLTLSATAHS